MNDRFKRVLAFIIDWNITFLPFLGGFIGLLAVIQKQSSVSPLLVTLCFLAVIVAMVLFVLRDFIFRGRSLGKRIFGLQVYDKRTLGESSSSQRTTRNLFLTLYPIDGIILLATGETIGDRAAGTIVLSERGLDALRSASSTKPAKPHKKPLLVLIPVVTLALVVLISFIGIIQMFLNSVKDTREYQQAYHYLTTSQSFLALDAEESDIRLNQYRSFSTYSDDSSAMTRTLEFGFLIQFRPFQVVLHQEDGVWQICEACTSFD